MRNARLIRPTLALPLLLWLIAACTPETPLWDDWSPDLSACDPREVPCAEALAQGLAAIHGVEWPADLVVEVTEPHADGTPEPFTWWSRTLTMAASPFDVLDNYWPPLTRYTGSVLLFGDRRLVFRPNARVDGDDAAKRHRLGFILSLSTHIRARAWPGHPIDQGSPWPTRSYARSALRVAVANLIERAIVRADEGLDPWAFTTADRDRWQEVVDSSAAPEGYALIALHDGHDPANPRRMLLDLPAALGQTCLPAIAYGDTARCVEVAPLDTPSEIGAFRARRAQAADAVLLEEAMRRDKSPAAALASTLRGHLGRDWNSPDGAGVRRDQFVFGSVSEAADFTRLVGQSLDGSEDWLPDGDGRWVAAPVEPDPDDEGEEPGPDPHAGGSIELEQREALVLMVSGTGGVDLAPFFEFGVGLDLLPLTDPQSLEDLPCEADSVDEVDLPCDVRTACCRQRLAVETKALLGSDIPLTRLVVFDPDTAVAAYIGPRWAGDRYSDRISAEVRFAIGIDRTFRSSNDEAAESRARRVLAWYENNRRRVVMIVPVGPGTERDWLRENSTFVHELTHSWQDARYGLTAERIEARRSPGDRESALVTAFEGHAELVSGAFEAYVEAGTIEDVDWFDWATRLIALIAPAIDNAEEPARTSDPWLPYVGGLAAQARLYGELGDFTAVGDRIADPPAGTGEVLAGLYEQDAAQPEANSIPTGDPESPVFADLTLVHRGRIGPWPLALRLAPDIGAEAAFDAVRGLTAARELVGLTPAGEAITWIEVRAAFGEDALAEALTAFGEALAVRSARSWTVVRAEGTTWLALGPDVEQLDQLILAIE